MTEKLYYLDSHLAEFDALVLSCEAAEGGFDVVLDRAAFFPEGGGQRADTGFLADARVSDVQERGGLILHRTDAPLEAGAQVHGKLDFEQRLRRMQNHSGEHIVSGLVHASFGCDNVGFHMGEACMTIDFNGELSWEELMRIERLANEAVREDFRSCNIAAHPECADCWAKLYCSGGCAANAYHASGSIRGIYEYGCELFKKRMECAIYLQLAEKYLPDGSDREGGQA